jgi:putative transposase
MYHLTQRSTDCEIFFRDDLDYEALLRTLVHTARRYDFAIEDYCLMPNHVHLLAVTRRPNLPQLMQYLFARHVAYFNRRHLRRGHLVDSPYTVTPIKDEPHLYNTHCYIAMNPVKASLCSHPREWPWCAYSGDGSIAPRPLPITIELVEQALAIRDAA